MLLLATSLLAPLVLFALGRFLEPDPRGWGTHEQLGFRPCWPMTHWNVPCPGCGVTTAVALAAHGRVLDSLRAQPFGLVLLAGMLTATLWALAGHLCGRDLHAELPRLPWKAFAKVLAWLALLAWLYTLARAQGALG